MPRHYYLNPYANEPLREDETKVMRVQGRACAYLLRVFARVYTYARAGQRLRWPPRRRRWRRTEKGGRIRATQRNNQCSLRVIIPLLDRFDCFKGVTRRSSGRAAARYIYLTIFLIILYTFAGRAARRRADGERGSLSAEEITSFSNSRFLSGWVMPHEVQRVMAKNVIVHRPWRTRSRDRGWFIGNIYFLEF